MDGIDRWSNRRLRFVHSGNLAVSSWKISYVDYGKTGISKWSERVLQTSAIPTPLKVRMPVFHARKLWSLFLPFSRRFSLGLRIPFSPGSRIFHIEGCSQNFDQCLFCGYSKGSSPLFRHIKKCLSRYPDFTKSGSESFRIADAAVLIQPYMGSVG